MAFVTAAAGAGVQTRAAFPLTVPQTAWSGTAKLLAEPVIPLKKLAAARTENPYPLKTYQRSGSVKKAPIPPIPVAKIGRPPSRVWSPVAIFSHIQARPAYGQIWPRGTAAGPPA